MARRQLVLESRMGDAEDAAPEDSHDVKEGSKISSGSPTLHSSASWWHRVVGLVGRLWQHLASHFDSTSLARLPGFLVSLIVHTALLLFLAVWTVAGAGGGGNVFGVIEVRVDESEPSALEVISQIPASGQISPDPQSTELTEVPQSSISNYQPGTAIETNTFGSMGAELKDLATNQGVGQMVRAPLDQSAAGDLLRSTARSLNATFNSVNVTGRSPQSRQRLALERGGNAQSEAAVEAALQWLTRHQRANGSWSLVHTTEECGASCTHPGSPERYEPAATGLALLAFLGAGYTHREGEYAAEVKRGIYYLLQVMEQTERGGSFLHSSPQGMYNQGVATFALCEAYQLSRDESLRKPCEQAIEFLVRAQNDVGGWGYLPKRPGDLTITGWQAMALKSADGAGLYIPAHTIVLIDKFLDSQSDSEKIFYGYGAPGKSETCTAIGLLLRLFRNWSHSDPRVLAGVQYLTDRGVSVSDIYRNYYVTLLLFHVGGPSFELWNPRMRESLVQSQSHSGHSAGSWYFDDKFAETGGRLYTTAMAAMTLEVYYRFSPIYLNSDRPFEY